MLNAKININGLEVLLTGDKEDIVYALRNTAAASIPTIKQIIRKTITALPTDIAEQHPSKYTTEDKIAMYEYLEKQSRYTVKQFEITRGGKTDPQQYIVCLVWDKDRQRYIHYNPKSEDKYINSYAIADVIGAVKEERQGFSLIHQVANKIMEKIKVGNDLVAITNAPAKQAAFPTTAEQKSIFKDFDDNKSSKPSKRLKVKS